MTSANKSTYEILLAQLRNPDEAKRTHAKDMLMQYVSHPDPAFRTRFAIGLGNLPESPEAASIFMLLLKDADSLVLDVAKKYLLEHPATAMEKLKALPYMNSPGMKLKAIPLLQAMGDKPTLLGEASAILQRLSADRDQEVKKAAEEAFKNIGSAVNAGLRKPGAQPVTIQEKPRQTRKS